MKTALRVALADDERDIREYLSEALARLGHEVVAVSEDGRHLVEQCQRCHPDLVIADVKMPGMDGLEAAAAVNRHKLTPIILISAHHDAEVLDRLGSEMVLAYLIKPITEADLKTSVVVAMLRFGHLASLHKEAADLRQALEDRKLVERAKGILMRRLRVDEEEAFRRMRMLASSQNAKLIEIGRKVLGAEEIFTQMERV